jgi:hypothetical protein
VLKVLDDSSESDRVDALAAFLIKEDPRLCEWPYLSSAICTILMPSKCIDITPLDLAYIQACITFGLHVLKSPLHDCFTRLGPLQLLTIPQTGQRSHTRMKIQQKILCGQRRALELQDQ